MKGCQVTSINQSNVDLPALTQNRRLDNNNSKLLTTKSCLILVKSNANITEMAYIPKDDMGVEIFV